MGTTHSSPQKGEPEAKAPTVPAAAAAAAPSNTDAGGKDDTTVDSVASTTSDSAQVVRRSTRQRTETNFLSPTFVPQKRTARNNNHYDDNDDDDDGSDHDSEASPTIPHAYIQKWESNFNHLKEYKQTNGNCAVKPSYKTHDGTALGKWVENQKYAYKRNKLATDRFERLEKLGVGFAKKATYDVPIDFHLTEPPPSSSLSGNGVSSAWISAASSVPSPTKNKKTKKRKRKAAAPTIDDNEEEEHENVTENKQKKSKAEEASTTATATSMTRSPLTEQRWEQYRQQLISYKSAKGDCNVPSTYKPNPPLAKWVENQRRSYHKAKLTPQRISLLQQIDFDFGHCKSDRWEFHLEELTKFKDKYKHVGVPQKYTANPRLGRWVMKQKERQRGDRLPREQFEKLKELGLFE